MSGLSIVFFWVVLPIGLAVVGGLLGGREGAWRAVAVTFVFDVVYTLWSLLRAPTEGSQDRDDHRS